MMRNARNNEPLEPPPTGRLASERPREWPSSLLRRRLLATAVFFAAACRAPDPKQELEILDLETYWAVDSSVGESIYIAPVARFRVSNKGQEPVRSIQATASFRRKGEEHLDWGTSWEQVTPASKPLLPGKSTLVLLKSDGRYYSQGTPETFFEHKLFKDARVQVYLRLGPSPWTSFAEADVERRIGTKTLNELKPTFP